MAKIVMNTEAETTCFNFLAQTNCQNHVECPMFFALLASGCVMRTHQLHGLPIKFWSSDILIAILKF